MANIQTKESSLIKKVNQIADVMAAAGVGFTDYLTQLTYLLFLKMDKELVDENWGDISVSKIPEGYRWDDLLKETGEDLVDCYENMLDVLSKEPGIVGTIFTKATNRIESPVYLEKLISFIDAENWLVMEGDVKGKLYEDILQKNGSFFLYMRLLSKGEYTGSIIIPYCNNKILLLNQFRHGTRKFEYEFPRGGFELNLSPFENARKEILEEIGIAVENMIFLGTTISDSSLGTGDVYIYKCYLPCIPTVFQKEEGIDSCILVSQKELLELVASNKIRDGFTLSAITKAISLGEL